MHCRRHSSICMPNAGVTQMSTVKSVSHTDPDLYALLKEEKKRQVDGLELIASENFTSKAVMECLGSCLTNKYAEGYPGARYYGGSQVVDKIELLCRSRALECFGLDSEKWHVNVQPYSGSPANFEVFTALLNPHDRIMGLDLPSGGHLTHGYQTATKKISASAIYFESVSYRVGADGLIDYDEMEARARAFRPKLIIAGSSAYARDWDYARMRKLADEVGALLMADMAHISGLVAARLMSSPFEHCHVVTTTSHKSLRGPRGGIIFCRRGAEFGDMDKKVDFAVFPSCQGGPHVNQVAALATAFREALEPEFRSYSEQVIANSRALAAALVDLKLGTIVTGGSDCHMFLWDLRPIKLTGSKLEKVFDECHITANKNTVPGDKSAMSPGGIRLGTPALTTRGMKEDDMKTVAGFLARAVKIALDLQTNARMLKEFVKLLPGNADLKSLGDDVRAFASKFYMPGHDEI